MKVNVEGLVEGLMIYWDEVENASRYYVNLVIGDKHKSEKYDATNRRFIDVYGQETFQEIKSVECDRHTKTYSFTGLSPINKSLPDYNGTRKDTGLNYYVFVEAEGNDGNIIDISEKCIGYVLILYSGRPIR